MRTPTLDMMLPDVDDLSFRIDSLPKAEWALEILSEAEKRKAQNEAVAAEAKRRVDAWLAQVNGQETKDAARLEAMLYAFMESSRDEILGGPKAKKKSRKLPHGTLGWREKPGRVLLKDGKEAREDLVKWLEANPAETSLYRMKVEPDMDGINAHYAKTHEILPGCAFEEPKDIPYVKAQPVTAALPEAT